MIEASDLPNEQIEVCAWELHCTAGNSDKFYQVFVVGSAVALHYGKAGTRGQSYLHGFPDNESAIREAEKLTDQKTGRSYWLSRDFTPFTVEAHQLPELLTEAIEGRRAGQSGKTQLGVLPNLFTDAYRHAGADEEGSR